MTAGYLVGIGVIIVGIGVLCEVFGQAGGDRGLRRATKWIMVVGLVFILGPMLLSCMAAEYRCAQVGAQLIDGQCAVRYER